MNDFRMKVAGRTAAVRAMYDTTRLHCGDYFSDDPPDFSIELGERDIAFERSECARLGLEAANASNAWLEETALLRATTEHLLSYDTLLFHGSAIAVDGAAYLFTAPSGTGKSTHTRLWRQLLGERAVMVNDDKPFLRITENGVLACGSPWNGKHRLDTNTAVPLKAVCVLERSGENHIRRIPAREALPELLGQSGRPRDPRQMGQYMDLLDKLTENVTFYRMGCNMAPEAARMAYEAMAGAAKI